MRLHAVCYYRSRSDAWTEAWRDADWTAMKLVKAVKRKPFGGFATHNALGRIFRFDSTPAGQATALNFAAQRLAALIAQGGYAQTAVIPIPSSDHTNPATDFTGARLARAIQAVNPAFLAKPVLYFAKAIPKSSEGGGRDSQLVEQTLRATADLATIGSAVLLDDVYTTGAHMRGTYRFLSANGVEVEDVFAVGRTKWDKPSSMFKVETEEVHCDGGNLSWPADL